MQQSVSEASGSGVTEQQEEEAWATKRIHLKDETELPKSPDYSSLIALYLQGNYELTAIPPQFFKHMALLQVLDLSHTSIKSLPKSLPKLVSLKKLLLRGCELFMELSPQVGKLKNLEELDLDETQIMNLPRDIRKLLKLRRLRVSFYHICGKKKLKANIMIHPESISILSQLADLSIDVNPVDKRWDDSVETVVKEVCNSKQLKALSLYLPKFKLLDNISLIYPSLSCFRFTVGHQKRRIISRVPHEVEAEFRDWEKCLKFVNGENIPVEIKGVLNYSTSFFLDNHSTAMNLSEFGIENMKRLKYCLLAECNKMETLIDGEKHYKRNEDDHSESEPGSVEHVLESLEYLSIYYMENLESIWRAPKHFRCMSKLKFLALHTCPQLTTIFSHTLLESFVNLEEIILEDCPQLTSLVSHTSVKTMVSDKIFLPSLRRLPLLYLPEFVSISNGLLIAPKLERLGCYNCPKLKSLSKMELLSSTLKIIKGECRWWADMSWTETEWGNRPDYLMRIFSPVNNEKDVMSQLAEDKDLFETKIENGGPQLDYTGERITGTDVTKSTPPPRILPSIQWVGTSEGITLNLSSCQAHLGYLNIQQPRFQVPKQAWSFSAEKNNRPEDGDEPKAKRWNRTQNKKKGGVGSANKAKREDIVTFQTNDMTSDGYNWMKSMEIVYRTSRRRIDYKCSTSGCSVQKMVVRDSQDTSLSTITYKGWHNHDPPTVMGSHNLQFQLCNDHRANSLEDDAEAAKEISPNKSDAEVAKIIRPSKGYEDVFEASIQGRGAGAEYAGITEASIRDELQQSEHENLLEVATEVEDQQPDGKVERMKTNVMNKTPSTLRAMSPPAVLPSTPILMNTSNVLPSSTAAEFAMQSLNQKSKSVTDHLSISQEDNNSSNLCQLPTQSPSAFTPWKSQLSAATLPTEQLQAQSFEELTEQNQRKGNIQLRVYNYYKQRSGLVKSIKTADTYTWRSYKNLQLTINRRRSFYRCACRGCRAKKSVDRSLGGHITEIIHNSLHNHPQSQPTMTSSLSAFSQIIRASINLTIKIPNPSFVTYEGGEINVDGSVFFVKLVPHENGLQNLLDKEFKQPSDRPEADIVECLPKAKKRCIKRSEASIFTCTAANFRVTVQRLTGVLTDEVQEEKRMRGIHKKELHEQRGQVIDVNLEDTSGRGIQCERKNAADHSDVAENKKLGGDQVKAISSNVVQTGPDRRVEPVQWNVRGPGWI